MPIAGCRFSGVDLVSISTFSLSPPWVSGRIWVMERFRYIFLSAALVFSLAAPAPAFAVPAQGVQSSSFVFIDTHFIWTLEIVPNPYDRAIPILNIITLDRGEWDFRPVQVNLVNSAGQTAEVERFSIDTGVEGEPYLTNYLRVLGNSFIGVDLVGEFEDFRQPEKVSVELGENLFKLEPVSRMVFDSLASKINAINVESPDIRDDFRVLGIRSFGTRERVDSDY